MSTKLYFKKNDIMTWQIISENRDARFKTPGKFAAGLTAPFENYTDALELTESEMAQCHFEKAESQEHKALFERFQEFYKNKEKETHLYAVPAGIIVSKLKIN